MWALRVCMYAAGERWVTLAGGHKKAPAEGRPYSTRYQMAPNIDLCLNQLSAPKECEEWLIKRTMVSV